MGWFDTLIYPLKVAVAWIIVAIHKLLLLLGLPDGAGVAWVLAIIGMTLLIRSAIIPLYFRQIMAQRNMQIIQPEMKAIREKYKGRKDSVSQQQQSQEMMALYRKYKANPMSSCWPMLVQIPIFLALFRVLASTSAVANGTYGSANLGPMTPQIAQQIEDSTFLGAPLSASLMTAWQANQTWVAVLCAILIVLMAVTMFLTQKMMMAKNMPKSTDPNDMSMRMMRTMTYTMPIIMGVTGFAFQVGVLLYWLTSNVFMFGQQAYTIHKMPAPGSDAHEKMVKRNKAKYEEFRRTREGELEGHYERLGVDGKSVAAAHAVVTAAEISGSKQPREALDERNLAGVSDDLDRDKLWEAVQLRKVHNERLREHRVKLNLEDKHEKMRQEEALRNQLLAQERVQPKRLTRRERAEQAQREARAKAQTKSKQTREQRRQAAKSPAPQHNKKKKRG